jgi:four helix bundle protein
MAESILREKSFKFALRILKLHRHFVEVKREYTLTKQVYRSGTSIGANVEEATQAESRADFIHKLSIAHKESVETHYWIRLLKEGEVLTKEQGESLLVDCEELVRMLTASIKTAKSKNGE